MADTNSFTFEVYTTLEQVKKEDWVLPDNQLPFYARQEFLSIIEKLHEKQFKFRYVIIKQNKIPIMIVCFEIIFFKGKSILPFIKKSPDSRIKKIMLSLFKLTIRQLSWNILSTGNTFLTSDNGIYACNTLDNETKTALLKEAFNKAHKSMFCKLNLRMMNNIYDNEKSKQSFIHDYIHQSNFASFPIEPDMILYLKNWETYNDYLNSLTSKYRVRANKVETLSKNIIVKNFSLEDIKHNNKELYKLYESVAHHVTFNIGLLSKEYFIQMKTQFPNNFFIDAYYLDSKLVGFYSYFNCNYLLVHFMGMDYDINTEFKLYNRMLLDMVKKGIEIKIKEIHLGRTATEIKSTIGAVPKNMHIHLHHQRNYFHDRMKKMETTFGTPEVIIRNPFKGQ